MYLHSVNGLQYSTYLYCNIHDKYFYIPALINVTLTLLRRTEETSHWIEKLVVWHGDSSICKPNIF